MENASPDRRKHKRQAVPNDAIAVCNEKVCRILNISEGGMAVNCINEKPFSEEEKATILCGTKNLFIKDLPVGLVQTTSQPPSTISPIQVQTVRVKFNYLNGAHNDQIKQYIFRLSGRS